MRKLKTTHICEIISKNEISNGIFDVLVKFAESAQPGQFIHVLCGDGVLLRRPISICDCGKGWLRFIFAVRGEGTNLLSHKKEGDMLDILGPLGMGFDVSKKGEGTAILIGGGIGIYPLINLAKALGNDTEAILGFRNKDLIVLEDEFNKICNETHIATDDGSYGFHGLVTDVLLEQIKAKNVTSIYACGPMPMMKEIKKIALENNIHCQLSLEERMGCGIGACAVCVCKIKGEYSKVCQNGPVYNAKEVDFDD